MKTVLYNDHLSLKAKMVEFGEWEMPIQYKGILHEHLTVRNHVGIFDVSHMGRISIKGKDAQSLLEYLSTNTINNKSDGSATYTVWCNNEGKCVDDLIIYKINAEEFFIVVNAGNRIKDLNHLKSYAEKFEVTINDYYQDGGILALQGPKSTPLITEVFPQVSALKPMHFLSLYFDEEEIFIARTGYTGEEGYEIYASNAATTKLWQLFLSRGQTYQLEPIGLGARDTLRLEMGYALYGHEISEEIAPTESVSGWTVKFGKSDFLGKEALNRLEALPTKRYQYGVVLQDKGIAREGYEILREGQIIGRVTSGTFSPSLNQAIAIVLVEKKLNYGDIVEVKIRQQLCAAKVVKPQFLKDEKK